jgi:hypothetical protein
MTGVRAGSEGTGVRSGSQGSGVVGGPGAPDGLSWTQRAVSDHVVPGYRSIQDIVETEDGTVVAAALGRMFISTDGGDSFTQHASASATGHLTYSPTLGRFVQWRENTGLWYSSDALNWTQSSVTSLISGGVRWVPWANKFVALRFGSTETAYWSADGITWEAPEVSGIRSQERLYVSPTELITNCEPSDFNRRCAAQGAWTTMTGLAFKFQAVWCGSYGWRAMSIASNNTNIYESTDGNTWSANTGVLSSAPWRGIMFEPITERICVWGNGVAAVSDDGGDTWDEGATGDVPADTLTSAYSAGKGQLWAPISGKFFAGGDALYSSP